MKKIGVVAAFLLILTSCGKGNPALSAFPEADMSGYAGLSGYDRDLRFVEMTVADATRLMDEGATFALFLSFDDCPWCNAVIASVNDAAVEADQTIGYIDTRRDPSWQNNTDIEDYDLFVEYFGEFLEDDGTEVPHLYVPYLFFIRDGAVVYGHQGSLPELGEEAPVNVTDEQREAITEIYREGFRVMEGQEET